MPVKQSSVGDRIEMIASKIRESLDIEYARALDAFPKPGQKTETPFILSRAEIDVLRLIGLGRTNLEIAESLFISYSTTRTHVKRIHEKCGTKNRPQLAVLANMIWDKTIVWRGPTRGELCSKDSAGG
jgi:DNA-binding CsgD family transcriptional regulator